MKRHNFYESFVLKALEKRKDSLYLHKKYEFASLW